MPTIKADIAIMNDEDDKILVYKKPCKKGTSSRGNVVRLNNEAWGYIKEIEKISGAPLSRIASTLIAFAYQNGVEYVEWDYENDGGED